MTKADRKQLGDPKLERIIEILQAPDQQIEEEAMEDIEDRPIFEERDTDQESRLDRKARARECK